MGIGIPEKPLSEPEVAFRWDVLEILNLKFRGFGVFSPPNPEKSQIPGIGTFLEQNPTFRLIRYFNDKSFIGIQISDAF